MAYNPPRKGVAWRTRIMLEASTNPGNVVINPTVAAGDFKMIGDASTLANLATTPTVSTMGTGWVTIDLSSAETNNDIICVQGIDQTSTAKEWSDVWLTILTTT